VARRAQGNAKLVPVLICRKHVLFAKCLSPDPAQQAAQRIELTNKSGIAAQVRQAVRAPVGELLTIVSPAQVLAG
jgi:hypothetical protein